MTTGFKQKWPLRDVKPLAQELLDLLRPACERVEIAGSIRRWAPTVGDIELLCITRPGLAVQASMFGDVPSPALLDARLDELLAAGVLAKRPNRNGSYTYGAQNKLLLHKKSGVPVDVFSTTAENWGMALFVRTGCAEWNVGAMSAFLKRGMRGHAYGGVTTAAGSQVPCPNEQDVFTLLGWPWTEPPVRTELNARKYLAATPSSGQSIWR